MRSKIYSHPWYLNWLPMKRVVTSPPVLGCWELLRGYRQGNESLMGSHTGVDVTATSTPPSLFPNDVWHRSLLRRQILGRKEVQLPLGEVQALPSRIRAGIPGVNRALGHMPGSPPHVLAIRKLRTWIIARLLLI